MAPRFLENLGTLALEVSSRGPLNQLPAETFGMTKRILTLSLEKPKKNAEATFKNL